MNSNTSHIRLAEVPLEGPEEFTWNRLHSEREELCEALLQVLPAERKKSLQARLREVDNALDLMMFSTIVSH